MHFVKMHGIGNDYVYINGFDQEVPDPQGLAQKVADRHFGIGADGLILLLPPQSENSRAHVRMRMFNADGSEAEMCGNGVRCVCKMAHDHGVSDANPMLIETGNGVLSLEYTLDASGKVEHVTVDMGEPVIAPTSIPVDISDIDQPVDQMVDHNVEGLFDWSKLLVDPSWITESGLDRRMTCVSMGNPHVTMYCQDVAKVPLEHLGPFIETHPMFPNRINLHVVQLHSTDEVTMRTWERGSGITLACGTGACAVCVAGVLTGRTGRDISTHLPGGDLQLEWRASNNHVYMTGSATEVFTGQWPD